MKRHFTWAIAGIVAVTLAFGGCGGDDERLAIAAPGDAGTTIPSEVQVDEVRSGPPAGSAQACQEAVAQLPAVAAFDRNPPATVEEATAGAAGWLRGRVVDILPGGSRPDESAYAIDGEQRPSGLQIAYADVVVEVAEQEGLEIEPGQQVAVEMAVAYLTDDRLGTVDEIVEPLAVDCTELDLTAFVGEPATAGDGARHGLVRLAGAVVQGADGVRSLDPLIPGGAPLGIESGAGLVAAAG